MLTLLIKRAEYPSLTTGLVTFLNPYSYLLMRREQLTLSCFDSIYYDGFVLASLMRLVGIYGERMSFDATSLAPRFFCHAAQQGLRLYFVGGEPGVIDVACKTLVAGCPGLKVVGWRHGFFSYPSERHEFVYELVTLNPDVVVVGMGTPLQERFLVDLRAAGWNGCGYTCGGFFHQTAKRGAVYYPHWINRLNLRFLYRMWDEPKLLRRYAFEYPKFLFVFAVDLISFARRRLQDRMGRSRP